MIILLSPSKGMSGSPNNLEWNTSVPRNLPLSSKIAAHFKKLSIDEIKEKFKISDKLALETKAIFNSWKINPHSKSCSIFTYSGDVYCGLDAKTLELEDLNYANSHLRIISGLYGLLRPSDVIMPYRLEIGYRHPIDDLGKPYSFWKPLITNHLLSDLKEQENPIIINLASNEYTKAINQLKLKGYKWINFEFLEQKDGKLTFASFNAKRARGLMCRYIIKNKLTNIDALNKFDLEDYKYSEKYSSEQNLIFVR